MRDLTPKRPVGLDVVGSSAHQAVSAEMARWV
jgi:hypothetical protein